MWDSEFLVFLKTLQCIHYSKKWAKGQACNYYDLEENGVG